MTLLDNGWSEEQAKALLDSLNLKGGIPDWKREHLQKLHNWCGARQMDQKTIDAQLEFIAYELCNSHEGIGKALKEAQTLEEAQRAVEPYVKGLREDRDWYRILKERLDTT